MSYTVQTENNATPPDAHHHHVDLTTLEGRVTTLENALDAAEALIATLQATAATLASGIKQESKDRLKTIRRHDQFSNRKGNAPVVPQPLP